MQQCARWITHARWHLALSKLVLAWSKAQQGITDRLHYLLTNHEKHLRLPLPYGKADREQARESVMDAILELNSIPLPEASHYRTNHHRDHVRFELQSRMQQASGRSLEGLLDSPGSQHAAPFSKNIRSAQKNVTSLSVSHQEHQGPDIPSTPKPSWFADGTSHNMRIDEVLLSKSAPSSPSPTHRRAKLMRIFNQYSHKTLRGKLVGFQEFCQFAQDNAMLDDNLLSMGNLKAVFETATSCADSIAGKKMLSCDEFSAGIEILIGLCNQNLQGESGPARFKLLKRTLSGTSQQALVICHKCDEFELT